MAELTSAQVIHRLRELKAQYIQERVGADPAALPQHFQEFLGYATFLYDYYATAIKKYRNKEAEVIKEEAAHREEINKEVEKRSDMLTVTEMEQRIAVRLSALKAEREYLEVEVKGATLHINGCQSLMKNWGDEAKGIR